MINEDGMSARVGTVKPGSGNDEPFLGRDMGGSGRDYSVELAFVVDEDVRKLLDDAHAEADWVLNKNRDFLDHLSSNLLEQDGLNSHKLADIFANVHKYTSRDTWLFHQDRPVSELPPVDMPEGTATDKRAHSENSTATTDDVHSDPRGDDQEN